MSTTANCNRYPAAIHSSQYQAAVPLLLLLLLNFAAALWRGHAIATV